ncbi:GmrSD restriction endonuclease domain-containing protein [Candidatus Poriferisocius sp.]|uniref:GmrSD restriction endonuclease domain-containing protein n=1 Tax=Candidatus Poriferisocius sp. TaxID=3101276 RepID=UPI003B010A98
MLGTLILATAVTPVLHAPALPLPTQPVGENTETDSSPRPGENTETDSLPDPEPPASLAEMLTRIVIQPERYTGYNRRDWRHWTDDDRDGLDTRQEVLAAESRVPAEIRGGRVRRGYWVSPYDNVGTNTPGDLDVDHVVPLAEAHQSGGWAWDAATRQRYANDLVFDHHLIAVSAVSNRSKGADDPARWRPPNIDILCPYLVWWTTIKVRWKLSMDEAEYNAISRYTDTDCADTTIDLDPATVEITPVIRIRPRYPIIPIIPIILDLSAIPFMSNLTTGPRCHPAYSPCLPNRPGDALNCGDLNRSQRPVTVKTPGVDPYRLDRDRNGIACAP